MLELEKKIWSNFLPNAEGSSLASPIVDDRAHN